MEKTPIALPPESKALLERFVQERDAAMQRLEVAILATKAALGVPVEWQLRSLDEGFVEVKPDGGNN